MEFNKIHKALFDDVASIVEASSFEYSTLWATCSREDCEGSGVSWGEINLGRSICIGSTFDRETWISIRYAFINDERVMFYEPTSMLVDYALIHKWFGKYAGNIRIHDAQNFHNCLSDVKFEGVIKI